MKKNTFLHFIVFMQVLMLASFSSYGVKHVVSVANFSFSPSSVNVFVGDTMRWEWASGTHTTTSTTIPAGAAAWNAPITSVNPVFEYRVSVAGTFNYICQIHSLSMLASFTATTPPLPLTVSVSATPSEIIPGQSSQLDATTSGGTGTYIYSWSSTPPGFSSTIKNPVVSPTVTTAYSCQVTSGTQVQSASVTVTVNAPFILVTTPNSGENWLQGSTQDITWTDNLPDNVKIDLYLNGTFMQTLAASTLPTGPFSWAIPANQPPSSFYKVRISRVSDASVADSSDVPFSVTGTVPLSRTEQNVTVTGGQTVCYDATQTITLAGGGTGFVVQAGGSAGLIAGLNILLEPGTVVDPGGYFHGTIMPAGPFCIPPVPGQEPGTFTGQVPVTTGHGLLFTLGPNPSQGSFRVDMTRDADVSEFWVDVIAVQGTLLFSESSRGNKYRDISIAGYPAGLYYIRMVSGDRTAMMKLIKL